MLKLVYGLSLNYVFRTAPLWHPIPAAYPEEISMNIAYRWFLGYLLNEPVPHFDAISYNFRHRFREDTIEKVFTWILFEAQKGSYLSPEVVFMDGTHINANANINKK